MFYFIKIAWQANKSMYTHSATFITSYYNTDKLERFDPIKAPKIKLSLVVDPHAQIVLLGNLKIVQSKASRSQPMCLQRRRSTLSMVYNYQLRRSASQITINT